MNKAVFVALLAALAPLPAQAQETAPEPCALTPREIVTRFMTTFYIDKKVREAFETWVVPGYIQHNPFAATGRDAAIAFLEPYFKNNPDMRYKIAHILADGDLVAVHAHGQKGPDDPGRAVIDILRVANCKVVEHWDVVQAVPEKSANENGMF